MISTAIAEDASELTELVNAAYRGEDSKQGWASEADLFDGTRINLDGMQKLLESTGNIILKCTEEGALAGCVLLNKAGNKLYLGMLSVRPRFQAAGIGKKLLLASEDEARRLGCTGIFMTVITRRESLIAWYLRHGYRDTGIRKAFDTSDPRHGVPKFPLELATLEKKIV